MAVTHLHEAIQVHGMPEGVHGDKGADTPAGPAIDTAVGSYVSNLAQINVELRRIDP